MSAKTFRGKRKPRLGGKRKVVRKRASTSALAVAKKALKLAGNLAKTTQETKYLSYSSAGDLNNNGAGWWGSAVYKQLTDTGSTTPLFNSDPLTGNKAYLKGAKVTWEIHMDNANNEEETCNFTVACVRPRADADNLTLSDHVSTIQGQTYFDPRIFKILYYKHFTRTMGGTSPGTAGEMLRHGSFYVPINKMVRFMNEGAAGAQSATQPSSWQDRVYFLVFTDNTSVDTESPRINYRTMLIAKDVDANN